MVLKSTHQIEGLSSLYQPNIGSTRHRHDGHGRVWHAYSLLSFGSSFTATGGRILIRLGDMIRYSSVLVITVTNVGQFGSFSEAACNRYYVVTPVFKGALRRGARFACSLQLLTSISRCQSSSSLSARSSSLYEHLPSPGDREQSPCFLDSRFSFAPLARASHQYTVAYQATKPATAPPAICLDTHVRSPCHLCGLTRL